MNVDIEKVKLAEEPKSSPAKASDEYIKLEREFDKLTEAIKLSHSTRERKAMRARKRRSVNNRTFFTIKCFTQATLSTLRLC